MTPIQGSFQVAAALAALEKKLPWIEPSPPKLTATWSVPLTLMP